MELYRIKDIEAITDKLDDIVDKASQVKFNTIEPNRDQCDDIRNTVRNFIKLKKRIIYGGTAYHELVKFKSDTDRIYPDNLTTCKDIEFYSPSPVDDLIELCNILKKKYKYVQGREALHHETYTIFINFTAYCDITYMPGHIFYNMSRLTIDDISYPDPNFIIIDILRQYNDPLLSYWRLKDKTFFRANMLLKHYPFDFDKSKITKINHDQNILIHIFENIRNITSLIHLGSIANNFYLNPSIKNITFDEPLVCISDNLSIDAKLCYNAILKYMSSNNILDKSDETIRIEEYHPFFQFWDRRVLFYYENKLILTLLGHNKICLPYHNFNFDDKYNIKKVLPSRFTKNMNIPIVGGSNNLNSIKIATFLLLFNYHLIDLNYQIVNKNNIGINNSKAIMKELLNARKTYLNKNNITVLDKSPYQEFIVECYGKTMDTFIANKLKNNKRFKKGIKPFSYDPNVEYVDKPDIIFDNTSGNIINNPKLKYIQFNTNNETINVEI